MGQTISVVTTPLCHNIAKIATDNVETNEGGCVSIRFYLWTLKFEFHMICTSRKSLLLTFPSCFKMKIIKTFGVGLQFVHL